MRKSNENNFRSENDNTIGQSDNRNLLKEILGGLKDGIKESSKDIVESIDKNKDYVLGKNLAERVNVQRDVVVSVAKGVIEGTKEGIENGGLVKSIAQGTIEGAKESSRRISDVLGGHFRDVLGPNLSEMFDLSKSIFVSMKDSIFYRLKENKEMRELAKAGTTEGSIYTHDIHLEKVLSSVSNIMEDQRKELEVVRDTISQGNAMEEKSRNIVKKALDMLYNRRPAEIEDPKTLRQIAADIYNKLNEQARNIELMRISQTHQLNIFNQFFQPFRDAWKRTFRNIAEGSELVVNRLIEIRRILARALNISEFSVKERDKSWRWLPKIIAAPVSLPLLGIKHATLKMLRISEKSRGLNTIQLTENEKRNVLLYNILEAIKFGSSSREENKQTELLGSMNDYFTRQEKANRRTMTKKKGFFGSLADVLSGNVPLGVLLGGLAKDLLTGMLAVILHPSRWIGFATRFGIYAMAGTMLYTWIHGLIKGLPIEQIAKNSFVNTLAIPGFVAEKIINFVSKYLFDSDFRVDLGKEKIGKFYDDINKGINRVFTEPFADFMHNWFLPMLASVTDKLKGALGIGDKYKWDAQIKAVETRMKNRQESDITPYQNKLKDKKILNDKEQKAYDNLLKDQRDDIKHLEQLKIDRLSDPGTLKQLDVLLGRKSEEIYELNRRLQENTDHEHIDVLKRALEKLNDERKDLLSEVKMAREHQKEAKKHIGEFEQNVKEFFYGDKSLFGVFSKNEKSILFDKVGDGLSKEAEIYGIPALASAIGVAGDVIKVAAGVVGSAATATAAATTAAIPKIVDKSKEYYDKGLDAAENMLDAAQKGALSGIGVTMSTISKIMENLSPKFDKLLGFTEDTSKYMKELLETLGKNISEGYNVAKEAAKKGYDTSKKAVKEGYEYAKKKGTQYTKSASDLLQGGLGWITRKKESKNDPGASNELFNALGLYQFTGPVLEKFMKESKWKDELSKFKIGTPELAGAFKRIAGREPKEFAEAQHKLFMEEIYNPFESLVSKAGVNISERSAAVKEAIFAAAGPLGAGIVGKSFIKSLGDIKNLSDSELITKIFDEMRAEKDGRLKWFPKFTHQMKGIKDRYITSKDSVLSMLNNSDIPPVQVKKAGGKVESAEGEVNKIAKELYEEDKAEQLKRDNQNMDLAQTLKGSAKRTEKIQSNAIGGNINNNVISTGGYLSRENVNIPEDIENSLLGLSVAGVFA